MINALRVIAESDHPENSLKSRLLSVYPDTRQKVYCAFRCRAKFRFVGHHAQIKEKQSNSRIGWKNSSMVPRDYGDLLFNEAPSVKNFGHFPTRDEVIQFIEDSQFNLCETYARTDIEPDTKEGIPGRYWVVKNKWQ